MKTLYSGTCFKLFKDGDLGILEFDYPGERINKFSELSLPDLDTALSVVESSSNLKALLFRSAKEGSYIVGADLNLIATMEEVSKALEASQEGQRIFNRMADLKIPTMAAIDGPCMGGGTEISVACTYRVASDFDKTVIGVPEVKLGFLPGWGGTFRLPKLLGLMNGMDMILTGKNFRPEKALKTGLVDVVIPRAIFKEKCVELAQQLAAGKALPGLKTRSPSLQEKVLTGNFLGRALFFHKAKEQVFKSTGGHYPAPLRILSVIEKNYGADRETFLKAEASAFAELWATQESKNLVRLFFMSENAKKDSGTKLSAQTLKDLPKIHEVAVLGAGVMGGGIAFQSASTGHRTMMKDVNMDAVTKGLAHARKLLDDNVRKKRMTRIQANSTMDFIRGQIDFSGFKGMDLVIEAIVENLDIKKKVFTELEAYLRDDALIASNTSSLKLTDMVSAFKHPERFVGLHFFNPVHKMPLVEIITHAQVNDQSVARAVAYVKALGKTPVVCKDGPGFLVNRLLMPWLNEAGWCLADGYDMKEMERAIKNFGMPMGSFELLDEIGLDVGAKVAHVLAESLPNLAASNVLDKIVAAKRFGRKGGLGFYKWTGPGGKREELDAEGIRSLLPLNQNAANLQYTEESIVRRLIYPMINEAATVLEEGLVSGPDQVDLGMIFGTGFPPFRGGLCRYADNVGLTKIVAELERLSELHGARLKPSEALKKFAKGKGTFY